MYRNPICTRVKFDPQPIGIFGDSLSPDNLHLDQLPFMRRKPQPSRRIDH